MKILSKKQLLKIKSNNPKIIEFQNKEYTKLIAEAVKKFKNENNNKK